MMAFRSCALDIEAELLFEVQSQIKMGPSVRWDDDA